MNYVETIGIDVSKETLDVIIHTVGLTDQFENSLQGYKKLTKWVEKHVTSARESLLFAFEHTGLYSYPLSVFLAENGYSFLMILGLELRRSLGITRGKDDKIDAKAIALYTFRRKEEITPYVMPSEELTELRRLLSLRERLVKHRAGYEASLMEHERFLKKTDNPVFFEVHKKIISELNKQILIIEKELEDLIKHNQQMKHMYDLITSIKGVGPQTAMFMIAFTNAFTLFKDWRKFASYSGIAPFPYQSGTSIRGRTKVSHLANKKLKSLLSNCAATAIIHNPEMRLYYQRRIYNGKHKMSTLNIIRNKLVARIFAVIERNTPYVNTYKFATC
ncbi:MAG: IS110 family transposase [Bacteroidales bacterium]|jgi:transposase|nr:IS110 family transposase [Bacteroidales bacterium]